MYHIGVSCREAWSEAWLISRASGAEAVGAEAVGAEAVGTEAGGTEAGGRLRIWALTIPSSCCIKRTSHFSLTLAFLTGTRTLDAQQRGGAAGVA